MFCVVCNLIRGEDRKKTREKQKKNSKRDKKMSLLLPVSVY
jgi:hypothetical protein